MILVKIDSYEIYEFKNFDKLEIRKFEKDDLGNICSIDLIKNNKRIILKSYKKIEEAEKDFNKLLFKYSYNEKVFCFKKED